MVIGITLFSMFFGAGNLIFAPFMGVLAGTNAVWALAGFICTAVILPISAVVIISRYRDALHMVGTISHVFAVGFISLIYLLIGPCIAIPRTASTSYEMFSGIFGDSPFFRIGYALIFFALCALSAWKPGKLKDILGKIMGPILVVMILVLCIGSLFVPAKTGLPSEVYASNPFGSGFIEGYQTMDILAAFCFGVVILINIRSLGYDSPAAQRKLLCQAAIVAGILLALLYAMLCITGSRHGVLFASATNGAQVLSGLAETEFGAFGSWLVAMIFLAACYNVCSGLLSCCGEYFCTLTKKGTYTMWLVGFAAAGMVVSSFGLDAILAMTAPILSIICPIAIALLAWGLIRLLIKKEA